MQNSKLENFFDYSYLYPILCPICKKQAGLNICRGIFAPWIFSIEKWQFSCAFCKIHKKGNLKSRDDIIGFIIYCLITIALMGDFSLFFFSPVIANKVYFYVNVIALLILTFSILMFPIYFTKSKVKEYILKEFSSQKSVFH